MAATATATAQVKEAALTRALLRETSKTYWRGTHRACAPDETLARATAAAKALGVTRLANVTGLDYLGLPVFMAIRPNARSLSVSQGKGLDVASAAASALMETLEIAHAEEPRLRRVFATQRILARRARTAELGQLPRARSRPPGLDHEITWVEGADLADGSPVFVPFDLIDCRFDDQRRSIFARSSNGLASGNVWPEAVCAGICEVIERDATSLWQRRTDADRRRRLINLESVRDRDCRALVGGLMDRGINVALWDVTTDIGVACIVCRINEAAGNERSALRPFWGAGCHLARDVALIRAVTEAAQARLTYIAGSRDDLYCRNYARAEPASLVQLIRDEWEGRQPGQSFDRIPSQARNTFEDDLAQLLARLKAAGLEQVIAVDLTDDRFGIAVVRIIVPGLEVDDEHNRQRPGPRAVAMAKALQ